MYEFWIKKHVSLGWKNSLHAYICYFNLWENCWHYYYYYRNHVWISLKLNHFACSALISWLLSWIIDFFLSLKFDARGRWIMLSACILLVFFEIWHRKAPYLQKTHTKFLQFIWNVQTWLSQSLFTESILFWSNKCNIASDFICTGNIT